MTFVRRRYYTWLVKAYFRRWKKTIFTSLIIGIAIFFLFFIFVSYYIIPKINHDFVRIGYAGSYTINTLPEEILSDISFGLTTIGVHSEILPGAAKSWKILNDGKTYVFTLQNDLYFSSGEKFKPQDIPYNFTDVKRKIMSDNTIQYELKNSYSPFLAVLSQPILKKTYGLRNFYISRVEENSGFLKSITLSEMKTKRQKIIYFYPTQEALITAFQLGEVNEIHGVTQSSQPTHIFTSWKNVYIAKNVDHKKLVALFFHTIDQTLSNKKVREALLYALPSSFEEGQRAYSFIPQDSIYYTKSPNEGLVDLELSRSLLKAAESSKMKLTISTTNDLLSVAKKIASAWKKIGVAANIQESNTVPTNFTVFLYSMNLPKDPDVYSIWHSDQENNIMHYRNIRIDKLLEDGRQTLDTQKRIQIYADLQKYLLDDTPTAFLYFPYVYNVVRK